MDEGLITIPRPPRGITPAGFWKEWLPDALKEFFQVIRDNAGDLEAVLSVRVEGEGGCDWSVLISGGEVELREGLIPEATVTLALSEKDFHDAVVGRRDALIPGTNPLEGELVPAEIAATIKRTVSVLEKIKGALLFVAAHPEDPFKCLLGFQGGFKDSPDSVVTIDQDYLQEMKVSGIGIVAAFMSGKIRVEGAMDLILNFAPLVM
jgi:putative sterol carrier protein